MFTKYIQGTMPLELLLRVEAKQTEALALTRGLIAAERFKDKFGVDPYFVKQLRRRPSADRVCVHKPKYESELVMQDGSRIVLIGVDLHEEQLWLDMEAIRHGGRH